MNKGRILRISGLFIMLFTAIGNSWAQSTILVEAPDGSHISAHATLSGAMAAAQPGDFVYIPGGSFNMDSVKVDVELHLVGVGHNPSATVATGRSQITGTIYLLTGCDNTTIEGLYLTGDIIVGSSSTNQFVNNILVSRCSFSNLKLSYNGSGNNEISSGFIFRENIIWGNLYGGNVDNVIIENSFLCKQIYHFYGTTFSNNIFFYFYNSTLYSNYAFQNCDYCTFNSNIFCGFLKEYNSSNFSFFNNVYPGISIGGIKEDNVDLQTSELDNNHNPIFMDYPGRFFRYNANYHVQDTSVCKNAGLDGSDMGVYGGDYPFKDSGLPMHPWVMSKSIAPATDADGKLKVEFQVIPQDR
ncbi:MAG: hypothetical protein K9H26_00040 [Prolixibacteraceae bacterium]|nr:hypothetical protein [Prolixibacteraceae bacterium]